MDPASPSWRQRVAHVAMARPVLPPALALGLNLVASPHLRPWLTYHGALVEDVDRAMYRAWSPQRWRRAWEGVAEARATQAVEAARQGHQATAFRHGVSAALAFQTAPYVTPQDRIPRRALYARGRSVYAQVIAHAPWPVRAFEIPWRGHALPAYLHLPRGVERPPVVVVVNAIGHYKETWTGIAGALVARGLAVLAFDGPGEGALLDSPAPLAYEDVTSPVLDALHAHGDVDATRAGILGISLAGALAAHAAAADARWRALAAVTMPFDATRYAHALPIALRVMVAERVGIPVSGIPEAARALSLAPVAPRITQPLFVVENPCDWLVPPGEGVRLVDAAASEEKVLASEEKGVHAAVRDFHRIMDRAADFLADVLKRDDQHDRA